MSHESNTALRLIRVLFFSFLIVLGSSNEAFSALFNTAFWNQRNGMTSAFSLTHANGSRNFTVGWTAGSGNGGPGGCRLQYRTLTNSWTNLALVNCDASGSSHGIISLPGDGWYGGAWSSSSIRLVRVSDSTVVGILGNVTCATVAASSVSTPSFDENCNNVWDDYVGTNEFRHFDKNRTYLGAGHAVDYVSMASSTSIPGAIVCESASAYGLDASWSGPGQNHRIALNFEKYSDPACTIPCLNECGANSFPTHTPACWNPGLGYVGGSSLAPGINVGTSYPAMGGTINLTSTSCQSWNYIYFMGGISTCLTDPGYIKITSVPTTFKYVCYFTKVISALYY